MILYKYFPQERAEFFENRLIRFTPANDFNDLMEGRGNYDWIVSPGEAASDVDNQFDVLLEQALGNVYDQLPANIRKKYSRDHAKQAISRQEMQTLRTSLKAYIGSTVGSITPKAKDTIYDQMCEKLGTFCLSESCDSDTMWGYYANHLGFVVGFDSENDFFMKDRDAEGFLGKLHKVAYSPTLPKSATLATMTAEQMFLTKLDKWMHEREWRMLDAFQFADKVIAGPPPIHLFEVPASAIREVVFGYRTTAVVRNRMLANLADSSYHHVKKLRVDLDVDKGGIVIVEL